MIFDTELSLLWLVSSIRQTGWLAPVYTMTGAPDTSKRLALLLPTPWKPACEYSPYQFAISVAICWLYTRSTHDGTSPRPYRVIWPVCALITRTPTGASNVQPSWGASSVT